MNERFLKTPNLPQSRVTTVFANYDDVALKTLFEELSITVISSIENPFLEAPVSRHADILANYVGNSHILADKHQNQLIEWAKNNRASLKIIDIIRSPYPNDCLLNFVDIGDYIICNKAICSQVFVDGLKTKTIIDVKQGYSKCSVCVVAKNTIITDDPSIFNAVINHNVKALLVEKGSVHIEEYNYGFIGGCCGLIDKDLLLFNGDLQSHTNFDKIQNFLYDNGVSYIDIKNKPLTDIGSIIPIMEKDD